MSNSLYPDQDQLFVEPNLGQIVSGYGQEIPQLHTTDQTDVKGYQCRRHYEAKS